MKSQKKSPTSKQSNLRQVAQRWALPIVLVVIGAGIAATYWLGNPRSSSTPVPPAKLGTAPIASAVSPTLSESTNGTVSLASLAPGGWTNDPAQLLNAGNQRLEQDDADGAIAYYLKALKLTPEDEEVHFNLGYAYSRKGNYDEAIRCYSEALRIFPDYAEAHNNLGNVFRSLRRYDEAATHFSAAIKINPDSDSSLNNLGRCLAEMGRTSDAIIQFGEAVRLNPNYLEALVNLGNGHLLLGNNEHAIRAFQQALKINPSFTPALKGLERASQKPSGPKVR